MKLSEFRIMPDSELLRRIYVGQLSIKKDLDIIKKNIIAIRKITDKNIAGTEVIQTINSPEYFQPVKEMNDDVQQLYNEIESLFEEE